MSTTVSTATNIFPVQRTHWIVVGAIAALFCATVTGLVLPRWMLFAVAAGTLLLLTMPWWGREHLDWFSSWHFLFYSAVLGLLLRSIFICADLPDHQSIDYVFLLGKGRDFLLWPAVLLSGGLLLFTIGYMAGPGAVELPSWRIFESDEWNERRVLWICALMLLASWIAIYIFAKETAGAIVASVISAQRGLSTDLTEYRSHSYLRLIAGLSDVVIYATFAMLSGGKRKFATVLLFFLSLSTSLGFYFFTSTRASAVFIFLNLLAISYYLNRGRLPLKKVLIGLVIAFTVMKLYSDLRFKQVSNSAVKSLDVMNSLAPVVLTTNMVDFSKTAHIVRAVPQQLEYEFGGTLVPLVFSWVPREVWPTKPVTNVDNVVGMKVYGASHYGAAGVPPGMVAELYWNFGFFGVAIGCIFAGFLLRMIYAAFERRRDNKNIALLYVVGVMTLGISIAGSSFNSVIIGMLTAVVPLLLFENIVTSRVPAK